MGSPITLNNGLHLHQRLSCSVQTVRQADYEWVCEPRDAQAETDAAQGRPQGSVL